MSTLFFGVDVSSRELDVSVWIDGEACDVGTVSNDEQGMDELAQRVDDLVEVDQQVHLVVEPTGGYEQALATWARGQGWQVSLPNPWRTRRWSEAQGQRAKTDRVDSRLLAQFGATMEPEPDEPVPEHVEALDQMLRRKETLEKMLRQEENRQHSLARRPILPKAVQDNLEKVIESLQKALDEIEAEIEEHVAQHDDLVNYQRLLLSVAGVGQNTVPYLMVFLYRWSVLTNGEGDGKALTAYTGLDPTPYQSGSTTYRRSTISKKGSRAMRTRLFAAAQGGTRNGHSPLRQFYQRLRERNKPRRLAWVAAARKILVWSWAVFRTQTPFEPHLALPS